MGFEEFLPVEEEDSESETDSAHSPLHITHSSTQADLKANNWNSEKISPNQVFGIITSKKPDWQVIIYDLINSEQLDPWDINVIVLTRKYFEKLEEMEERDYYISSRVLLAAALLLRIKSEFLLNKHIKSIDEILFGKKDEEKKEIEHIEIDEDELPILMPKTPLSRQRRITLPELMSALNKAIDTESRRIKREVAVKRAKRLSEVDIPQFRKINLKDRIRWFYAKILTALKKKEKINRVGYSKLVGSEREEKLACFLPLLHLSYAQKLWLEQQEHLDEIWIYLFQYFDKNRDQFIEDLEEDIEEMKEELSESVEEKDGGDLVKARRRLEEKKKIEEEVKKELMKELEIVNIDKEEKIDKVSGFDQE